MDFQLGIDAVQSYRRLSYKVWYALAEFIDNSTQSFRNNEKTLLKEYAADGTNLTVEITYKSGGNGYIIIEDNSIGMDEDDLKNAFIVGKRPQITSGRSKYGLGLKTAAFWFGDEWEIKTKKLGHAYEYTVSLSLSELLSTDESVKSRKTVKGKKKESIKESVTKVSSKPLKVIPKKVSPEEHYTIITIKDLNQQITPSKSRRTKDFLRSFYRRDLQNGELTLIFQNTVLTWNESDFKERMLKDEDGEPYFRPLNFKINGKKVKGWAGILEKGSRRDAGFSILQSNRVIKGWPDGYRPEKLFGEQEGGVNNLVNQRLVGEIDLDGFEVSHTKDDVLFWDDEEDLLDDQLYKRLKDYRDLAEEYRKPKKGDDDEENRIDVNSIVTQIFSNLKNPKFSGAIKRAPVLPPDILEKTKEEYLRNLDSIEEKDIFETTVSDIQIRVIINKEGSQFDPYLIIRTRAKKDSITIVINQNHSHWDTLVSSELMLYFIKHCVFDGLAEWRARHMEKHIDPDTIKMLKDIYLRKDIDIS